MVVQYKCPNCGADMAFHSESGMLHCESCGRNDTVESVENKQNKDNYNNTSNNSSNVFNENEVNEYHCKNCGAVLITDKDTAATTCSYCGAGVILEDRLSGSLAPGKVIPFTISKQEAQDAFKKWCKKSLLTPSDFMTADRIKSITGIYVPFWLYDLNGMGEAEAECTKVRTYTEGEYNCTETNYYHLYRSVDLNYLKVPVDASEKMNDELMDKLEPYHYENLKEFNMPYLAGFVAEKYNYDDKELYPRVENRAESYVDNYINSTINGYTTTTFTRKDIFIRQKFAEYVLFPVWMFTYDYKKKIYTFALNGQTGKLVGKPPISKGKVAAWFGGISGISFIIIKIIAVLLGGNII